jgi:hypothetical protein
MLRGLARDHSVDLNRVQRSTRGLELFEFGAARGTSVEVGKDGRSPFGMQ